VAPLALADRVVERYRELYKDFEIKNDDFIRTTEVRHRRGVEALIARIAAANDFYTAKHEGWYCSSCEAFYHREGARRRPELPRPRHPTTWESEENVFFRLSKYAEPLLRHYQTNPTFVRPETRLAEVASFVRSGLNDLSVSRSKVKWGIPFPGHPGHVVYVWLDALANYITALGFGGEDDALYRDTGESPRDGACHVIGKDISALPRRVLAGVPDVGRPSAADDGVGARLVAPGREEGLQVVGNIVRPDNLVADFGAGRAAVLPAARDGLRPGRDRSPTRRS
jgi:methionyl-tRNA synthetase